MNINKGDLVIIKYNYFDRFSGIGFSKNDLKKLLFDGAEVTSILKSDCVSLDIQYYPNIFETNFLEVISKPEIVRELDRDIKFDL